MDGRSPPVDHRWVPSRPLFALLCSLCVFALALSSPSAGARSSESSSQSCKSPRAKPSGARKAANRGIKAGARRCGGRRASCETRSGRRARVLPSSKAGRRAKARRTRCGARQSAKPTAPETFLTAAPESGSITNSSSVSFSFSSSKEGSTFSCSLDGAGYSSCASPATYHGLSEGSHSFKVRATYKRQADRSPASVTWTVAFDATEGGATDDATPSEPAPTAEPSSSSTPQTSWAAVGTRPLSDAEAAGRVTRRPETRPENAAANGYVPTDSELATYRSAMNQYGQTTLEVSPLAQYITGRPGLDHPSTDDLLQWAAHKWGIPEDVVRAQMATESWWNQNALGDRAHVPSNWFSQYPAAAQIAGTSDVYQSMGVMQVKWIPDGSVGAGTEPLRWKSVAFNLDYYGATIRYYYDGHCGWCTTGYSAGQDWNSIGAWFAPYPWNNADAQAYVNKVQTYLHDRVWAQPGF